MESQPIGETHPLPALDPGVTLLETDGSTRAALQTLVLDTALLENLDIFWVDVGGYARTDTLLDLAPSSRVLDRVHVARAFTAFQHYSLIKRVVERIHDRVSLLVFPAVDYLYRSDDLRRGEGETMLQSAIDIIAQLADATELPVLVTRTGANGIGSVVADAADRTLECVTTDLGPRFSGEEFETLFYHGQGYIQTTLAYWRHILANSHPAAYAAATTTEVSTLGLP